MASAKISSSDSGAPMDAPASPQTTPATASPNDGASMQPVDKSGNPLELLRVSIDPATTPSRLYQLFSARGGGAVVFLPESAERLVRRYGWTAQEAVLDEDEARTLRRAGQREVQTGERAYLMRCDGVAQEQEPGTVICGAPSGLDRVSLKTKDVRKEAIHPSSQFIPSRLIESVFAFSVVKDGGPISSFAMTRADLAMRGYKQLESFYRAYANCVAGVITQLQPDLYEINLLTQIRNTLARLANPVQMRRAMVHAPSAGLSSAPLLTGQKDTFVGSVFVTTSNDAALRLMAAASDEVEQAVSAMLSVRGGVVRRMSDLARRGLIPENDYSKFIRCVQGFGVKIKNEKEGIPWKNIALLGGGITIIGIGLSLMNRD